MVRRYIDVAFRDEREQSGAEPDNVDTASLQGLYRRKTVDLKTADQPKRNDGKLIKEG